MSEVVEVLPDERTDGASRLRRLRGRLVVAGVSVVAFVIWWFATAHPGTHLGAPGGGLGCMQRDDTTTGHAVRGGILLEASAPAEVLAIRLVDAENVVLEDARVVPAAGEAAEGKLAAPGVLGDWPIPDPQDYLVDWSRDRPLVGARLDEGVVEVPYLHLTITDLSQHASMSGWEIEYRMYGTRWVTTYETALQYDSGDPGGCMDDDEQRP